MTKANYILNESVINTISLYLILKKLISPFDQWEAHKLGIIDAKGKKLKTPISAKEREAWDLLTRFAWNFKVLLGKFVGPSKLVSYLTIAYLLKENLNSYHIMHNKETLNETLLSDFSYIKQHQIHCFINEMDKVFDREQISEENIEVKFLQYEEQVQRIVTEMNFELEGFSDEII